MKQLIYRDLFIYVRQNYIFLAILAAFSLFSSYKFAESSGNYGILMYCAWVVFFWVVTMMNVAFSYDEADHSACLLKALPARASQVVGARYLSMLLSLLLCVAVMIVPDAAIQFVRGRGLPAVLDSASVALLSGSVMLLYCAVMLPVIYRFTYMKTRYIWRILYVGIMVAVIGLGDSSAFQEKAAAVLSAVFGSVLGMGGIALAAFALFAVSMWLSVRIFKAKEV